jgi:hypothetical protein
MGCRLDDLAVAVELETDRTTVGLPMRSIMPIHPTVWFASSGTWIENQVHPWWCRPTNGGRSAEFSTIAVDGERHAVGAVPGEAGDVVVGQLDQAGAVHGVAVCAIASAARTPADRRQQSRIPGVTLASAQPALSILPSFRW